MLAPVLLIALGLPVALHLDVRAAGAVSVGVLAAATLAASAMRRTLSVRDDDEPLQVSDLLAALPGPAVLVVNGRAPAANTAARDLLGLDAPGLDAMDAARWFERADDAEALLHGPAGERSVVLRARVGRVQAGACARVLRGGARLVLFDTGGLARRMEAQRVELETLARRLMRLQEDERAALSRELHDDLGQSLTAIKLRAAALAHAPAGAAAVAETSEEIAAIADQTVDRMRDLARLLRPPQLDALGLEAALRWQAGVLFRGERPRLVLDVAPLGGRPPREVELACFRIAQEALTNALRHARAGRVHLRLHRDDRGLHLRIEDDGRGIDAGHDPGLGLGLGLGLVTMRERACLLGGAFAIDSRPGRTRVDVLLPLRGSADACDDALVR